MVTDCGHAAMSPSIYQHALQLQEFPSELCDPLAITLNTIGWELQCWPLCLLLT